MDYNELDLTEVRRLAREGKKIDAIKALREAGNETTTDGLERTFISLTAAKDFVDKMPEWLEHHALDLEQRLQRENNHARELAEELEDSRDAVRLLTEELAETQPRRESLGPVYDRLVELEIEARSDKHIIARLQTDSDDLNDLAVAWSQLLDYERVQVAKTSPDLAHRLDSVTGDVSED